MPVLYSEAIMKLKFFQVLSEMGEMETADLDVEIVRWPSFSSV